MKEGKILTKRQIIAKGLGLIFLGNILLILAIIPIIGWLISLGGLVLTFIGLGQISRFSESYKKAFVYSMFNIPVVFIASILSLISDAYSVANVLTGGGGFDIVGFIATLLEILSVAMSFAVMYYICVSTAKFVGNALWKYKSATVYKVYGAIYAIDIFVIAVAVIPFISIIAYPLSLVTFVLNIVGTVLYLVFLYKSKEILSKM